MQFRTFKIVYRRYAGLFFCLCVDINDNNLAYLEAIHNFVEVSPPPAAWSTCLPRALYPVLLSGAGLECLLHQRV